MATNYKNSEISSNTITNSGAGIMYRTMEQAHQNFYASNYNSNTHTSYENMNSKIINNTITITNGYQTTYHNVAYGIESADDTSHRRAGDDVNGDAGFLQHLQHTDVCHTLCAAAAEHDGNFLSADSRTVCLGAYNTACQ